MIYYVDLHAINENVKVVFALERQQENGATVNLASL